MLHTDRAHGIMFHHFYNDVHPRGQGAISADDFAKIIEFYGRDRFLTAKEWYERALNKTLKNTDVCLTYDDALLCQYDVALPVMEYYKLTGFWFVYTLPLAGGVGKLELYRKFRTVQFANVDEFYTAFYEAIEQSNYAQLVTNALADFKPDDYLRDFVFYTKEDRKFRFVRDVVLKPQKYEDVMDLMIELAKIPIAEFTRDLWMNKKQVQQLYRKNHVIGLHSHTHPTAIANLSLDQQRAQYTTNFKQLTKLLGTAPLTMSHPNNSYNADSLSVLESLGITLGFRANMLHGYTGHLEYPREDHTNIAKLI